VGVFPRSLHPVQRLACVRGAPRGQRQAGGAAHAPRDPASSRGDPAAVSGAGDRKRPPAPPWRPLGAEVLGAGRQPRRGDHAPARRAPVRSASGTREGRGQDPHCCIRRRGPRGYRRSVQPAWPPPSPPFGRVPRRSQMTLSNRRCQEWLNGVPSGQWDPAASGGSGRVPRHPARPSPRPARRRAHALPINPPGCSPIASSGTPRPLRIRPDRARPGAIAARSPAPSPGCAGLRRVQDRWPRPPSRPTGQGGSP
jgi:hypothetical protein